MAKAKPRTAKKTATKKKAVKKQTAKKAAPMTDDLYHEMGHTAYIILQMIDEHLLDQPLYADKELQSKVQKAFSLMFQVWQGAFAKIPEPEA